MYKKLLNWSHRVFYCLSRRQKRYILMGIDTILCITSLLFAFYLRNLELAPVGHELYWDRIVVLSGIQMLVFRQKGLYRPILRYSGTEFILTAAQSVLISSGILIILTYALGFWPLPRTVLLINSLILLVFIVGMRLLLRNTLHELNFRVNPDTGEGNVVIYGAGMAGSKLAKALQQDYHYRIVAFVDDNPELHEHLIQGIKVEHPNRLGEIKCKKGVNTVILAMPSIGMLRKQEIIQNLESFSVVVKTVPTFEQLLSGEVSINQIRNVSVADLLGREEIMPYPELLGLNVTGRSVLVTGAGGSIGSEICRQVAKLSPKCLILYEISEYSLYNIDLELSEAYPHLNHLACLGNILDENHIQSILEEYKVDTVYHAAAYKHVPLVEHNPCQGVYNNVRGTWTVAKCAIEASVSNFVLISTDKAVRPTNVMGTSKRIAELTIQGLADIPEISTCFAIVRFGNVLDSSGSVVPRFRQQIAQSKPITVTHPEITRYFMSIPEAVRLVMQAGAMARGGEVFLLDMGEPILIYDLALQMVRLSGLEPDVDIPIQFTGLRPGEKLYEELLIDGDNIQPTQHPKIYCANEAKLSWLILETKLNQLLVTAQSYDEEGLIWELMDLVPEYSPQVSSTLNPQPSNLKPE
ncbi:MAG: polysaccharide biosynthesis protein [Microcystaceae cyanobacterium]